MQCFIIITNKKKMSNDNEVTISIMEYSNLISRALLLEELIDLGVEEWEHFNQAVENLGATINDLDDEMQGEI